MYCRHFFLANLPNFALMAVIMLVLIALIAGLSVAISNPKPQAKEPTVAHKKPTMSRRMPKEPDTCDLYDVPDETAAMIMAIVADGLHEPLEQIRFISIREV